MEKKRKRKSEKESKKSVVLFIDFDGTLVDSIKAHWLAFNLTFKKAGIKQIDFKTFDSLFGFFSEEIIRRYLKQIGIKKTKKEIEALALQKKENFLKTTYRYVRLFPKVNLALQQLQDYYLVLESNASLSEIKKIARFVKLRLDYFDLILSKEKIKHRKPNPELIKKALKLLGLKAKPKPRAKPRVFVVGDSFVDVLLANNAKAIAILINKKPSLEIKKCEMLRRKCREDFVIRHFYQLPKLLARLLKNQLQ
jgi:HAD superfamily hydrolase (TIGR01549 family)